MWDTVSHISYLKVMKRADHLVLLLLKIVCVGCRRLHIILILTAVDFDVQSIYF